MSDSGLVKKRRGVNKGDPLTRRELEVLRLIARGLTAREAADRLFVSERTVGFHQHNIYQKLGVESAIQAVAAAVRQGLLPCFCGKRNKGER